MDVRIEVAERLHFEVRHQILRALDAVENRRDDHHRARRFRNADEIEPGKPPRRDEAARCRRCRIWIVSSLIGTIVSRTTSDQHRPRASRDARA